MHLFKFHSQHKYFLLLTMFKHLNIQRDNIFMYKDYAYNTQGNVANLVRPQAPTTLFQNSILCAGPNLWNSLPDIKTIINLSELFQETSKIIFVFGIIE